MASITDLRAYSTLQTDNLPRFLARDSSNRIFSDSGAQVGTLSGVSQGAFMIPYRPNASPQAWMYVGAQEDYRKYSAPDIVTGAITEFLCGIEEQQQPPDACPNYFDFNVYFGFAVSWVAAGTAGPSINLSPLTDTAGSCLLDPACGTSINRRYSVQVTAGKAYEVGMAISIGAGGGVVQDIFPAINQGVALTIQAIYYFSGTTGRAVIVPTQGPTATSFQDTADPQPSLYDVNPLAGLRRGSIVNLSGGAGNENLFVLSSTVGPGGISCFEVVTTKAFLAGDAVTGVTAIAMNTIFPVAAGNAITSPDIAWTNTGAGLGTQSETLASSPFDNVSLDGVSTTQQYDYVGVNLSVDNLANLSYVRFVFNVGTAVDFTTDAYYVEFTLADFLNKINVSANTPFPSNAYVRFMVPINELIRLGTDPTRTLSDCNGIQIAVQTTATAVLRAGGYWVGVGYQPDVGETGSPYTYVVRTRSSLTGAVSNPSPVTRYGVGPRRQSVRLTMHDSNTDTQDDLWDIFRQGGTVNSMRYIGSTINTGGIDNFTDNYFDTAALGGSLVEYDNYQPWPTIDLPFTVQWGGGAGITIRIYVIGTVILLVYSSAAPFVSPAPTTILRWLPGTLILVNGLNAFTLWNRPQLVTMGVPPAAFYYAYRFEITENAGAVNPTILQINEPIIANQPLPYLWGPDAEGTVFGAGDPFRPGTVYFCKSFNPDSAPDKYNQELVQPSEPLMGGEIINGLSLAASTERWWALYPNFGTGGRYQKVEAPVPRGLVAPYAKCTNGQTIFFWAKDGIWTTAGQDLTGEDLYNIFPHDGVAGQDYVYAGKTVHAPDYRYASMFRLCFKNNYLYADYRDSDGRPRTLVCDLRVPSVPSWCVDEYADPIGVHYAVEQQSGTLLSDSSLYPALVMGDDNGLVHVQRDLTNDNGSPITGVVATQEFNGGDIRSDSLFNDQFLDLVPAAPAGVIATILEGGTSVQSPVTIPSSAQRIHTNVPIGLELNYMGVMLQWADDFTQQAIATLLRSWQPMSQSVPIALFIWKNQGTAFGMEGYKHIRQILFAYKSTAPVTLTITVYDGTAPAPIILPSTGGAYRKTLFTPTFNKGMIYFISADCADAEWQPYLSDTEFYVAPWERGSAYTVIRDIATAVGVGDA